MLVSVVLDPAAFDAESFDALYRIKAEDFLKGIQKKRTTNYRFGKQIARFPHRPS